MPESVARIERLEREMQRLRAGMLVLAIALTGTFILGATQCTPDELTLRRQRHGSPRSRTLCRVVRRST